MNFGPLDLIGWRILVAWSKQWWHHTCNFVCPLCEMGVVRKVLYIFRELTVKTLRLGSELTHGDHGSAHCVGEGPFLWVQSTWC